MVERTGLVTKHSASAVMANIPAMRLSNERASPHGLSSVQPEAALPILKHFA